MQICKEVFVGEYNVVVAEIVERFSDKVITEHGRIAFDECMTMFFRQQVMRNALNLRRRTSVQCGQGYLVAETRRNRIDDGFIHTLEEAHVTSQEIHTLFVDRCLGRVFDPFNESVHLRQLDAL